MDELTRMIDDGYAWTAARIAVVPTDRLDLPTPCDRWNLEELLDHTIESMTMLTEAVEAGTELGSAPANPHPLAPTRWDLAIAELAARTHHAWRQPAAFERDVELPIGSVPATDAAKITLLEVVVHGWDIGQASGEAPEIPDAFARLILDFAVVAVDGNRGDNFAAELSMGDTPSERVVAVLGRKPL